MRIIASRWLVVFTDYSFVDLLNIGRACNQDCRQCFAVEPIRDISSLSALDISACVNSNCVISKENVSEDNESEFRKELSVAENIIKLNWSRETSFFLYPKEITTSPEMVDLMALTGQKYVLTNGASRRDIQVILDKIKKKGIRKEGITRLKFTLFSDSEEQSFWTNASPNAYLDLLNTICFCKNSGFDVQIYTIITPQNIAKLPLLYSTAYSCGASVINLLRLMPVGNAINIDYKFLMKEDDLKELMIQVNVIKLQRKGEKPYISYGMSFGPDFYGNAVWDYLKKGSNEQLSRQLPEQDAIQGLQPLFSSGTLCPVIDNKYIGISMKTGNLYWCYMLMSMPNTKVGKLVGDSRLEIDDQPEFSRETLREKLRGKCSKGECEFQNLCLGGCRSRAYVSAVIRGEPEPEYAGMDLCRTSLRKNLRWDK